MVVFCLGGGVGWLLAEDGSMIGGLFDGLLVAACGNASSGMLSGSPGSIVDIVRPVSLGFGMHGSRRSCEGGLSWEGRYTVL